MSTPATTPVVSSWAARAAAAAANAEPKPCEGGAVKLAPLKLSELKREDTFGSTTSLGSLATPASANSYVAPHKRKEEEAKPKEFKADDLDSEAAFPTLGATPKPMTPGASWGKIKAKLTPVSSFSSTGAVAPTTPVPSNNPFAALEEEGLTTPKTPSIFSYSAMIKERIKKEEEAALAPVEEETDDPMRMGLKQLEREGWAALRLPPIKDAVARKEWVSNWNDRMDQQWKRLVALSEEVPTTSYKGLKAPAGWDNTVVDEIERCAVY